MDLNSDVGESFGAWTIGQDEALVPFVSSVNIACGFHAGDPLVMERTIALARSAGAGIGAHPGYPDLAGFGRRDLEMALPELEAAVLYQVAALAGMARAQGVELRHVKPHGALYHRASRDPAVAEAIARAVRRVSAELILVGMAGSATLEAGRAAGLPVAAEAFVDRPYQADGTLRPRRLPGGVMEDPAAAAAQALRIAREGRVQAWEGGILEVRADTLCIHGDTPGAVEFARAVRAALEAAGISVEPMAPAPW